MYNLDYYSIRNWSTNSEYITLFTEIKISWKEKISYEKPSKYNIFLKYWKLYIGKYWQVKYKGIKNLPYIPYKNKGIAAGNILQIF